MTVVKIKPSLVIDTQAPEFIRSDYAKFITFLQKYYEFMEQSGNALDIVRYLDVYNDIDEQTDEQILSVFYSLFLPDFPQIIEADKKFLLKHIADFYTSKGSIESIKAFFRIVYGEEVEVYLPKVDILKLNAGIWKKLFKIKITGLSAGTVYELLGQEIYQLDDITGNKTVKATVVDYIESTGSIVITADNIVLNFDSTKTVYSSRNDTGVAVTLNVVNQLADETITYSGLNYKVGDLVKLSNGVSNTENIVVDSVSYGKVKNLILNASGDNYSESDEITFDDHYRFDASSLAYVSTTNNTINLLSHSLNTGDIVHYRIEPDTTYAGAAIGGLVDGGVYYVIKVDTGYIKLATSPDNASNGIEIDLTSVGTGVNHYIVYDIPNIVRAKAKITRVASEELFGDVADLGGEFPTFAEDEDKLLLENGYTLREEFGETNVFKTIAKGKYVTDQDSNGVVTGSLTSDDFSLLRETQENDTVTYSRSSYIKSNGLVRSLLPAFSDTKSNYALDWASNKGLNVKLNDEELRVGFAYDTEYGPTGAIAQTQPLTFIIEFQSQEDYNNLDFYELTRKWGNTTAARIPQVKPITSWHYDSAVEYEDLHTFSELQHLGIYPESADTHSFGKTPVSQRGFDPENKPILVIREVYSPTESSVLSTFRPWEYRFVFKQNKTTNIKVFVNPQPIKLENQLLRTEISELVVNEDGSFLIQEQYAGLDLYTIQPGGAAQTTAAFSLFDGTTPPSSGYLNIGDEVQIVNPNYREEGILNSTPLVVKNDSTTERVHNEIITTVATNSAIAAVQLRDNTSAVTVFNSINGVVVPTSTNATITGATASSWAGITTNGTGDLLVVQKSETGIFSTSALYTPTNNAYYATLATATSTPTWTNVKLPETAVWGHTAYGNGKYVILEGTGRPLIEPVEKFLSGGKVLYSTDRINWNEGMLPSADCWTNLKFVNGSFWALPYGATALPPPNSKDSIEFEGGRMTISAPAGAVFTRVLFASYGTPTGSTIADFAINPAQHAQNSVDVVSSVFIGKNSATINVTNQTFGADPAPGVAKRLYITLEYAFVQTTYAVTSEDAITWRKVQMPLDKVSDIAYGNGVYVLTTYNKTNDYAFSYDGINWKLGEFPINDKEINNFQTTGNAFFSKVVFGGDKFIALISNDPNNMTNARLQDRIAVSSDGVNWTLQSTTTATAALASNSGSKASFVDAIYTESQKHFTFVSQEYSFTANTTTSGPFTDLGRGFGIGGYNAGANYIEIDGVDFGTEVLNNPTAGLTQNRYAPVGMHSANIGYAYGGYVTTPGFNSTEIDGIRFSDQTTYNPAASASIPGGHVSQGAMYQQLRGYQINGHVSPVNTIQIQRFVFATETPSITGITTVTARHGQAIVTSATKGYSMGGYDYLPSWSAEIDGLDMVSETAINPSATLTNARHWPGSLMSTTRGYAMGGNSATAPGFISEIDGIQFDTEVGINPAAALSTNQYAPASFQPLSPSAIPQNTGYLFAGYNGVAAITSTTQKFTFSSETSGTIAASPTVPRYHVAGVSQAQTTYGPYTKITSYTLSITGFTGGCVWTQAQQLSAGKMYYVGSNSGSSIGFSYTKEQALAGNTVSLGANAGAAKIKLLTDRIYAGNQDSFTKGIADAQFNIYAKKRSVGTRDSGIKYNRNPLVATFDDIEKQNLNYTSDNKFYIHEAIQEFQDYIIMERSELFGTDQVNLELERDPRTTLESENYVTYPYLAAENSVATIVQSIDDIDIPNYSKVRLFVDKSVLQSSNNTNRQAGTRTFNDYGFFGAGQEFTILNNEKESFDNLSDPILANTSQHISYRNNFNYLIDAYDNTPYVNGVIAPTRDYSSGPGEFGNTGSVSFINNSHIRTNSQAVNLENNFYNIAISNQQGYYDNDVRNTALNREFYTLSFNEPKELGDKFDKPFSVSLRNIVDSTAKTKSFKNVDYGDKIYLDTAGKNDTIVRNFERRPIDFMPIFSGNATFVENYSSDFKISGNNWLQQTWPTYRDPFAKNAQNGNKLLIAPGLTTWAEYQNLPDYLKGLVYSNSVNDSSTTNFYASHPTRVYLLRDPAWNVVDLTGWTLQESNKNYLTGYGNTISVYYRDFQPGGPYTINNNSAMYLFQPQNVGTNPGYGYAKRSGVDGWDSQVYSSRGFFSNVYARGQVNQVSPNPELMFGLNTDPAANASYDSLDFSWYFDGGVCRIYENSNFIGNFGNYTAQTILEIYYDGSNVYYLRDGTVQRIVPRAVGAMLYFDSSFYKPYPTTGGYISFQNLEYGELVRKDITIADNTNTLAYNLTDILLEDSSATIAAEINKFGYSSVSANYSATNPTIAIEFYSPTLAASVATSGLTAANTPYHYIMYCDKADYLNVSTDTQKTTYTFYNCWSPSESNFLSSDANIRDYIVTIRDLSHSDYIIKRKHDALNRQSTASVDSLYEDVFVTKATDNYGKYVKFYGSYANAVAETSALTLSTLGIGNDITTVGEETLDSSIIENAKRAYGYYGTITDTDVLLTFAFNPNTDISSSSITIPNHKLTTGDQVKFRVSFEGALPGGLSGTDGVIYFVYVVNANQIKLASTYAAAISVNTIALTSSTAIGKKCYLQLLPRALDFGSTQFLLNTKTLYSVAGSSLAPYISTAERATNVNGGKQIEIDGRNDILQLNKTVNIFSNVVEFQTGDYVEIALGSGDRIVDFDGNITTGPATVYAYAVRHTDNAVSFVKKYEEAIAENSFLTGYNNNNTSIFTNTVFRLTDSYLAGNIFYMPSNQEHNLTAGTAMNIYSSGLGLSNSTKYYVSSSNLTTSSFSITTNTNGTGVAAVTPTSYNNLITVAIDQSDSKFVRSPMITGTVKQDVAISYMPYYGRETGSILNFELQNQGSYDRVPNPSIIPLEGRLGSGAEVYPIVEDIGAVIGVEFIDGGTHSVNRTMYLPYSFFSSAITGNWQIGEQVLQGGTAIGTLVDKNGRYFKIQQNGAAVAIAYGNTLTGAASAATAVVGRTMNISGVTNARPAVVTTTTDHFMSAGDYIYVSGINTVVAAGYYYVSPKTATTFYLFSDSTVSTPVDTRSTSAYTSGGTVSAGIYTATGTALPGEVTLSSANGPTTNYENDKNLLVTTSKLQDSYYYQDYSYAIRSGTSYENWKPYFNKLVHPAGIAVFGEVDYNTMNAGQALLGNTTVVSGVINNTKTAISSTVTTN